MELFNLDELEVGLEIHRSHENVCLRCRFRGDDVVLKRVVVSRVDSLSKFEQEVAVLSRPELEENFVTPIAVVRAPPHYGLILPFKEHGSLSSILQRNVLPLSLVICFALDVARGLEIFHGLGLVHRDIKSANVLVGMDWKAMITDLGSVGKAAERDEKTGQIIRNAAESDKLMQPSGGFHKKNIDGTTLGYTAPEVLRNNPAVQASDVYGIAMTMAEMLTGVPPFVGMEKEDADMHTVMDSSYSEHALILAITMERLRPGLVSISEQGGMPSDLIRLIREMWHDDIDSRPTAAQCVKRLEEIAKVLSVDTETLSMRTEYAAAISQASEATQDSAMEDIDDERNQALDVPLIPIHPSGNTNGMDVDPSESKQPDHPVGTRVKFNKFIPIGSFATSGRRGTDKMEDRHSVVHWSLGIEAISEITIVCVFDGHSGAGCAHFSNQRLPFLLGRSLAKFPLPSEQVMTKAMVQSFHQTDTEFHSKYPSDKSGCTALAAALWSNGEKVRLVLGNAGDCRAVLCRRELEQDIAVRLTTDHNAENATEQNRIRSAGGDFQVTRDGKRRVNGFIQVTRAIGDNSMKQFGVTAEPEVFHYEFSPCRGDEFLIFATDGVWDTISDDEAVRAVRDTAKECGLAAKRVAGDALNLGSSDNISVVVVFLKHFDQHTDTWKLRT